MSWFTAWSSKNKKTLEAAASGVFHTKRNDPWLLFLSLNEETFFTQSRVISVHSWYLTSLINLSFYGLDFAGLDPISIRIHIALWGIVFGVRWHCLKLGSRAAAYDSSAESFFTLRFSCFLFSSSETRLLCVFVLFDPISKVFQPVRPSLWALRITVCWCFLFVLIK